MKTNIAKWGNSLAVRLPMDIAEEMRLSEGSPVEVRVEAGVLILRQARPRYTLAELLVGINPKAMRAAWKWGPDKGREAVEE
jgi:antitoxin MazE